MKKILEKKFRVEYSPKPNLSEENLSEIAEKIFQEILKGNFEYPLPKNAPLIYTSDEEIKLYSKLKNITGEERKKNEKIQNLFEKFIKKNQDLELNIIKSQSQIIK